MVVPGSSLRLDREWLCPDARTSSNNVRLNLVDGGGLRGPISWLKIGRRVRASTVARTFCSKYSGLQNIVARVAGYIVVSSSSSLFQISDGKNGKFLESMIDLLQKGVPGKASSAEDWFPPAYALAAYKAESLRDLIQGAYRVRFPDMLSRTP